MHPFLSLAVLGISAGAVSILPSFQKHPLQSKFSRRTFAHRGLFDHLSRPENSPCRFRCCGRARLRHRTGPADDR